MALDDIIRGKSDEEIADLEKRGFRKDQGKWKFRFDISDILEIFNNNEDTKEFRSSIIKKLEEKEDDIQLFLTDEREVSVYEDIMSEFNMLDTEPEVNELDTILGMFYDWADENNVWIESLSADE